VLVTVANGNGTANAGLVPGDGASSFYASSQDVLAVGASGVDGATVSYQPEVAAQFTVTGPTHDSTDQYVTESGTSFSSPLTAGFAARLIAEARAAGRDLKAPELETLIKYSARDTELPPTWEGYGVIDEQQLAGAIAHARAGTLPERPDPDVSGTYVERVSGSERALNAGELPPGL
jgi:subtilisin family serine protease